MKFKLAAKQIEKLVVDNSPLILTAIGVSGTIATAYLTGKASFKAYELIDREHITGTNGRPDFKQSVQLVWKEYVPAVLTGVLTSSCIICANRIGTRRAAAMAAAYSVSERAFSEYKEKVIEKIGEIKEQKVRDEVAQDQVTRSKTDKEVVFVGTGDQLCYDSITGRYFQSTVETLRKAMNDINAQINNNMYATLSEFYDLIGLSSTPYSQEIGWNADCLLDLQFSTVLADDGRPCVSLNYRTHPIRDYHLLH